MKNKESTAIIRRLITSLLPIQALAVGLPSINTLLNSIIIGNFLGQSALAVIGFVSPLAMCVEAAASVLSSGMQIVCSRMLGRGDKGGLVGAFSCVVTLSTLIGALLTAAMLLFPNPLAALLGASGENAVMVAGYIRGLGIGAIFTILSTCMIIFLQLERKRVISTISVVAMLVVNLGGNLLNVLSLHWGMFGVAFFTSMGSVASVIVSLGYILLRSKLFRFSIRTMRMSIVRDIFKTGSPRAAACLGKVVRRRVVNYYVFLLGGNVAMAAMSVAGTISNAIGNTIESGYSGAGRTVASILVGQRDTSSLRDLTKSMARVGSPIYLLAYALVFFLARPMALFLGADPMSISTYVMIVRLYCLWFVLSIVQMPPKCIYHAMDNMKITLLLSISSIAIFPILVCLCFGKSVGLPIVVSTTGSAEVLNILLMAVIFVIRAHRLPRSLFELCYIPSTLSAPRENRFKATLRTIDDATQASENAMRFCKERGMSGTQAYICALCIEEMTVDAIRNRFSGKKNIIDLRMIYEDGHATILMRDDCKKFDPVEWLKLCKPEDETRSMGIRMVSQAAQEMKYINTLGMNVLTIHI